MPAVAALRAHRDRSIGTAVALERHLLAAGSTALVLVVLDAVPCISGEHVPKRDTADRAK